MNPAAVTPALHVTNWGFEVPPVQLAERVGWPSRPMYVFGMDVRSVLLFATVATSFYIVAYVVRFLTTPIYVPPFASPRWPYIYHTGIRFFYDAPRMVDEGYRKYKNQIFRVPRWRDWVYIVTGDKLIEEFFRLPEDVSSLPVSAKDEMQIPYTMGENIHTNPYHLPVLATNVTRNLDHLIKEVMDEVIPAFEEYAGKMSDTEEWTEFNAFELVSKVMTRTFSRIIVGAPVCRDEKYIEVSRRFSSNIFLVSLIINLFPQFMHPIIGPLFARLPSIQRRASAYLGPLIEERKRMMEAHESGTSWMDKPNDYLSWLMDAAEGSEFETKALEARILVVNRAAMGTSTITFTQALLNLASRPSYIEPLRHEAEEALRMHGYTRASMGTLAMMDSFFKESMRFSPVSAFTFPRLTLQSFTFSNGVHVPAGTRVAAPYTVHFDPEFYESPEEFDAYRFVKESKDARIKNTMVAVSPQFLGFGYGKHVCVRPGRFLVSYLLKAFMLHILLNYEFKLPDDGTKPKDISIGFNRIPDPRAKILLRRRQTNV